MGRSLSFRLTSRFAGFLLLSQLIIIIALFLIIKKHAEEKDRILVKAAFREAQILIESGGVSLLKEMESSRNEVFVRVVGPDQKVIYSQLPLDLKNFDLQTIESNLSAAQTIDGFHSILPKIWGEETIEFFSGKTSTGLHLLAGISTDESEDFFHFYFKAALIIMFISIFFSLLVGYVYSRNALKPVRNLIKVIGEIQAGQTYRQVPVNNSNDELGELTILFNSMIDRIDRLIKSLQQSLDAIAHDLRTPITHMINKYESTLRSPKDFVSKDFVHDRMEEAQQLAGLVSTLLEISAAQAGQLKITKQTFDISQLFRECVELYEFVADDALGTLEVDCGPILVKADRNLLKRVIANLIDNALKYSDPGVRITIFAAQAQRDIVIRVTDSGWGIPLEDQNKIFERLYRGDQSRSTSGMGLGLSFVRLIVERHGGTITVQSQKARGTVFEILLRGANASELSETQINP